MPLFYFLIFQTLLHTLQLGFLRYIWWLLHGTLLTQMLLHRQATTATNRGVFATHPI